MKLLPLPHDGRCVCGCSEFTLARDKTEYSPVELVDGEYRSTYGHQEDSSAPDAVRLFCSDCGNYFQVPDSLQ